MATIWVRLKNPVAGCFTDLVNNIFMQGKTPVQVTLPNARVSAALASGVLIELSTAEKNRIQAEITDAETSLANTLVANEELRKDFNDVEAGEKPAVETKTEREAVLKAMNVAQLTVLANDLAAAEEPPIEVTVSRKAELIEFILALEFPDPVPAP